MACDPNGVRIITLPMSRKRVCMVFESQQQGTTSGGLNGRSGVFRLLVIRGTIVNRTYFAHKHLDIYHFLLTICGPYLIWSSVICNAAAASSLEATGRCRSG